MKVRFILLLLLFTLFLRCVTVVHGIPVIRFRNSVAIDDIAADQPLLPSGPKPLLAPGKKPATGPSGCFGDFNIDGVSYGYRAFRHPVHPPAMHVQLCSLVIPGLHHYRLAAARDKLLLVKRSIPDNKGSPVSACISTLANTCFKYLQFQNNDLYFYICFSLSRPASLSIPVIGQPCPYLGLLPYSVPGNAVPSYTLRGDCISRVLPSQLFKLPIPSLSPGVLLLSLYQRRPLYIKHSADKIHAPPGSGICMGMDPVRTLRIA